MNLRVCSFCNSGDVDDELHTIFMCSNQSLTELRKKAIDQICLFVDSFYLLNDVDRFRYCFMASDKNICHVIGCFFMKVLKFVEGKRGKTDLLLKSRHLLYRSSFPKSIIFIHVIFLHC
jgi:hypothetical protein